MSSEVERGVRCVRVLEGAVQVGVRRATSNSVVGDANINDQTTRHKWIAVFRRQGVAIYMRRGNGRLGRVLDPISEI